MNIALYKDATIELNLASIARNITRLAPDIKVVLGREPFRINGRSVSSKTYASLPHPLLQESKNADYVGLFTEVRYDSNYFWEDSANLCIFSLWGWENLTDIPRNNGAVFFLCSMLLQKLEIGVRHDDNTGCINDYWMDKTGVDLGMRSGTLCGLCVDHFDKEGDNAHSALLDQIIMVLRDVGAASRAAIDICDYWNLKSEENEFDVFLCHNSHDKQAIRDINTQLKGIGIRTWFDEEQLPPGRLWQELLENQIASIKTVAVFVGKNGSGPWQDIELRAFLSEFVRRRCPVIPVILPDCSNVPSLPLFLQQFTWVDFRKKHPDAIALLRWGITGKKK